MILGCGPVERQLPVSSVGAAYSSPGQRRLPPFLFAPIKAQRWKNGKRRAGKAGTLLGVLLGLALTERSMNSRLLNLIVPRNYIGATTRRREPARFRVAQGSVDVLRVRLFQNEKNGLGWPGTTGGAKDADERRDAGRFRASSPRSAAERLARRRDAAKL
jgi:hypothetical protein